ncbi:MAG: hypothetical protein N2256_10215 [Tepidimonas ignava]|uniref:Uncharacterized protein n=1 Tax=Tepidimonas ignava TaxID=114249 RepID=A0A4R3LFZ9_9BURK|nr:hypothetical protein [Tepidimonas ignava]MCX7815842.1 hypothetical protein [Tepidimonas ignava]TCS98378.1 hypothetical protein EDC36_105135 [Tepidimonas ignava]TSE19540.1 hypothetical protein Tigna_02160 [Tepidimonas ignava]
MSTILTSSAPTATPTRGAGASTHVDAARRAVAPRALATLLLAAGVAALAVVTDRLMDTWADGHLLAAWVLMWAVVFLGSVLLASPARRLAQRLGTLLDGWAQARARARAEARTAALARLDHRVQAELDAQRTRAESPAAWDAALAPLATVDTPDHGALLREWAASAAEGLWTMPSGRRYSLYYV